MTVKEKIESIKQKKTKHSTEELDRLGWKRYEEIKNDLEMKLPRRRFNRLKQFILIKHFILFVLVTKQLIN